jgi:hypothetical protein
METGTTRRWMGLVSVVRIHSSQRLDPRHDKIVWCPLRRLHRRLQYLLGRRSSDSRHLLLLVQLSRSGIQHPVFKIFIQNGNSNRRNLRCGRYDFKFFRGFGGISLYQVSKILLGNNVFDVVFLAMESWLVQVQVSLFPRQCTS